MAAQDRNSDSPLSKRLSDWRDFIGTRMNHPKESSSELKAERPRFMDDLKEAAAEIERLEGARLELLDEIRLRDATIEALKGDLREARSEARYG